MLLQLLNAISRNGYVLENAWFKSNACLYCFQLILETKYISWYCDPLKSVYAHLHYILDFLGFPLCDRSCLVRIFILDPFL